MAIDIQKMNHLAKQALISLEEALTTEVPEGETRQGTYMNANNHFAQAKTDYGELNKLLIRDAFYEFAAYDTQQKEMIVTETLTQGAGKLKIAAILALDIITGYIDSYDGKRFESSFKSEPKDLSALKQECLVETQTQEGKKGYLLHILIPYAQELGLQRKNTEIIELIKSFYGCQVSPKPI